MSYTNPVVGKTVTASNASKRGQSSELARRLGQSAREELDWPICVTCSTQTSYTGHDLQTKSEDSDYKW